MKTIGKMFRNMMLLLSIVVGYVISCGIWQSFLFETLELPSPFPLILILGLITLAAFIILGLYFKSLELLFALTYWFMMAGIGASSLYTAWEETQRRNGFIDFGVATEAVVINTIYITNLECHVSYMYEVDNFIYTNMEEMISCRRFPPGARIAIRYIPPDPSQAIILRNRRARTEGFTGCMALVIPPLVFFGLLAEKMSQSKND